jgi:hypothetical protein
MAAFKQHSFMQHKLSLQLALLTHWVAQFQPDELGGSAAAAAICDLKAPGLRTAQ